MDSCGTAEFEEIGEDRSTKVPKRLKLDKVTNHSRTFGKYIFTLFLKYYDKFKPTIKTCM